MTTIQDMLTLYPFEDRHLDAVMAAYAQVGIRVVFSLQYADRKGLETIPYWKDIFRRSCTRCCRPPPSPSGSSTCSAIFEGRVSKRAAPARALGARPVGAPKRCTPALMARTMSSRAATTSRSIPTSTSRAHGAAGALTLPGTAARW